jgi:hypothetical protein
MALQKQDGGICPILVACQVEIQVLLVMRRACRGLFVEFRVRRTRWAFPCFSPWSCQFSNNSSHNYYEEIKLEPKRILIYECRCNERLKAKAEGSASQILADPSALAFASQIPQLFS